MNSAKHETRRRRARKPSGSKATTCTICGEVMWKGRTTGENPAHQVCRAGKRKKTCEECGKQFDPVNRSRKKANPFCSKPCADKAWSKRSRKNPEKTCEICGVTFRHTDLRKPAYTCSKKCADTRREKNAKHPRQPRRPKWKKIQAVCADPDCSRTFTRNSRNHRYCGNRKCTSRRVSREIVKRYHSDPVFRDQVITKAHMRRADKLGVPGVVNLETLIGYLMDRDDGTCQICLKLVKWEDASPDHRIPLSRGGAHEISNIQLSHLACNLRKGSRYEDFS